MNLLRETVPDFVETKPLALALIASLPPLMCGEQHGEFRTRHNNRSSAGYLCDTLQSQLPLSQLEEPVSSTLTPAYQQPNVLSAACLLGSLSVVHP